MLLQVSCASGSTGYGRKRRDISKRQADASVFDTVSVGATLKIAAEEVILESKWNV